MMSLAMPMRAAGRRVSAAEATMTHKPDSHPFAGATIAFVAFVVLGWICAAAMS
jgi:hypothetical protein